MKQTLGIIQKQIRPKLPVLAHDYNVKQLGIFGSVARGKDTAKSDVDIMVSFYRSPDFLTLFGWKIVYPKCLTARLT